MRAGGVFRCPGCHQRYAVDPKGPRTRFAPIVKHVKEKHGIKAADARWVRRRLKEM